MSTTTNRGYGFEYSTILEANRLLSGTVSTETQNWLDTTGITKFNSLTTSDQEDMVRASNHIIDLLSRYETWLQDPQVIIEHVKAVGGITDVSDLRFSIPNVRSIGLSLKSNHDAVKHPRVSPTIDVAQNWLGLPTDVQYMNEIRDIFTNFTNYCSVNNYQRFNEMTSAEKDFELIRPVSESFARLLERSFNGPQGTQAVNHILPYLVGTRSFYKAKADFRRDEITIVAFDFNGDLATRRRLRVPNRCIEVRIEVGSNSHMHNYINLNFDQGWEVKMRLHNGDSRINSSLKWDVQFVGTPRDAWTTTIPF